MLISGTHIRCGYTQMYIVSKYDIKMYKVMNLGLTLVSVAVPYSSVPHM